MTSKEMPVATSKKRILVVDDYDAIRGGLTKLINTEPDLVVCGEAGDERSALAAVEELQPDVAVVDWSLKDKNASKLIATLSRQQPPVAVLVLSIHEEEYYADAAIRAGARGYVMKQEATETVIEAIRCVAAGQRWLSAKAVLMVSPASYGARLGNNGTRSTSNEPDSESKTDEGIGRGP